MSDHPPVPQRVVEAISAYGNACVDHELDAMLDMKRALIAAIADAIEQARLQVQQDHCAHLWENEGTCLHCGVPKP